MLLFSSFIYDFYILWLFVLLQVVIQYCNIIHTQLPRFQKGISFRSVLCFRNITLRKFIFHISVVCFHISEGDIHWKCECVLIGWNTLSFYEYVNLTQVNIFCMFSRLDKHEFFWTAQIDKRYCWHCLRNGTDALVLLLWYEYWT